MDALSGKGVIKERLVKKKAMTHSSQDVASRVETVEGLPVSAKVGPWALPFSSSL
jgi:hypothetical protein